MRVDALLVVVTGITIQVAWGILLYSWGDYEALAWCVVLASTIVLTGGLSMYIQPLELRSADDSDDTEGDDEDADDNTFRNVLTLLRPRHAHHLSTEEDKDEEEEVDQEDAGAAWAERRRRLASWRVATRVCGLVSLILFALLSIWLLYLIFFSLMVNAPFRVDYDMRPLTSPSLHRARLPGNNVTYSIVRAGFPRDKFSIVLRINAGSMDEDDGEAGLAELASHCIDASHSSEEDGSIHSGFAQLGARLHVQTHESMSLFTALDVPFSSSALHKALQLLLRVAAVGIPDEWQLDLEKRILRAEERLLNSTDTIIDTFAQCHHWGAASAACQSQRFLARNPRALDDLAREDVARWFDRWFRLDNMHLYLVGDFDLLSVDHVLQQVWGKRHDPPRAFPSLALVAPASPDTIMESATTAAADTSEEEEEKMKKKRKKKKKKRSPFQVRALRGVDGLEMRLTITSPYRTFPQSVAEKRDDDWAKVFHGVLLNQFVSAMSRDGYSPRSLFSLASLDVTMHDSFALNVTVRTLRLRLRGHPEKGVWRVFLDSLFRVLRNLAEEVPAPRLLGEVLATVRATHERLALEAAWESSIEKLEALIGNGDPRSRFMDLRESDTVSRQVTGRGFTQALSNFVQAEAALFWKSFVECVSDGNRYVRPPYSDMMAAHPSLLVVTDSSPAHGGGSYVSQHDVRMLVHKVMAETQQQEQAMLGKVAQSEWIIVQKALEDDVRSRARYHLREPLGKLGLKHHSRQKEYINTMLHQHQIAASSALPWLQKAAQANDQRSVLVDWTRGAQVEGGPHWQQTHSFPLTGTEQFVLTNGMRVNLKPRLSGQDMLPCAAPRSLWIEAVSLGGAAAAQSTELRGVCEFLNLNVAAGYLVQYPPAGVASSSSSSSSSSLPESATTATAEEVDVFFDVHEVESYASFTPQPVLRCEDEFLTLRFQLHTANRTAHAMNRQAIREQLELVRLGLQPTFDDHSIERGARLFRGALSRGERRADALAFMDWTFNGHVVGGWRSSNAMDPLTQNDAVTDTDILHLDAVKVGRFVREQFTADRMELNIVGDFDAKWLIQVLDETLGRMPLFRGERIGHDVYNTAHLRRFGVLTPPAPSTNPFHSGYTIVEKCTMGSVHPGRVYLSAAVLSNADYTSARGHHLELLALAVFEQTLLDTLRRDNGWVAQVGSSVFTSHITQRFGYFQVRWVLGLEEPDRNTNQTQSNEKKRRSGWDQVDESIRAVQSLSRAAVPFTHAAFQIAKARLVSRLSGELQEAVSWLPFMRGLSIPPPSWHGGSSLSFRSLTDLAETDILGRLERATLEQVNSYFSEHVITKAPLQITAIETVVEGGAQSSVLQAESCIWHN